MLCQVKRGFKVGKNGRGRKRKGLLRGIQREEYKTLKFVNYDAEEEANIP